MKGIAGLNKHILCSSGASEWKEESLTWKLDNFCFNAPVHSTASNCAVSLRLFHPKVPLMLQSFER